MEQTKKCKHCQTDIPVKAKVCPNCRRKQNGKLKWIILAVIAIFFFFAAIGGSEDSDSESTESTEQPLKSQDAQKSDSPLDDDIIDVDISDCHVKYIKHEVTENMSGDKCVAIYYEFTNNSDSSKSFIYTITDKCFQDGVELETSLFHVNDESHDSDVEIKPGKTVTVCSGFVLRDKSTEIELEVSPFISFKDTPDDKMILSIK